MLLIQEKYRQTQEDFLVLTNGQKIITKSIFTDEGHLHGTHFKILEENNAVTFTMFFPSQSTISRLYYWLSGKSNKYSGLCQKLELAQNPQDLLWMFYREINSI